jgi:hypothetical protein
MRRHRAILNRIDTWTTEQARLAEAGDMQQAAESARMRLVRYLEVRRNGETLPVLEPSADQDSPARERLRVRLDEMGQRLRRYMELRDTYGIR